MEARLIGALEKLLPGWTFVDHGWLHFIIDGNWAQNHNTSDPWDYDHLCGEIERALLKREDVFGVTVRSDRTGAHYVELDATEKAWAWQNIAADRSDELTALLEAVAQLQDAEGKDE